MVINRYDHCRINSRNKYLCSVKKTSLYIYETYKFENHLTCKKTKCGNGEFLCSQRRFCISIELVCDGVNHCLNNDDEIDCGWFSFFIFMPFSCFFFIKIKFFIQRKFSIQKYI